MTSSAWPRTGGLLTLNVTNVNDMPVVDRYAPGGGNNADQFFLENGVVVAIAPATIDTTIGTTSTSSLCHSC